MGDNQPHGLNVEPTNGQVGASQQRDESNVISEPHDNEKPTKRKSKTRAQRRKAKLVRERPTVNREIVLDNENLVKYYKLQAILQNESEFEDFMVSLRTTLPASFRINAFDYGQAKILRFLIQKQFNNFYQTSESQVGDREDSSRQASVGNNAAPVPTIGQLEWYPNCLAWQMNISRLDLKKSSTLQNLHRFIMAETENGFISRQESVSMIPPLVLDVQRGQTILDMCAAPGSKTAQLLEYLTMNIHDRSKASSRNIDLAGEELFNEGLVVANDVDNKRCYMLVHQSNRLNSPNCAIINEDASRLPDMKTIDREGNTIDLKFDRILCDAPCTGDGTVRKNPDVWRKWSVANANNFHGLQSKILRRGVEMLKENGLLVYSTCSMNPVEDEAVVANVLRHGQGSLVLEDCSHKLQGLKYRPGVTKWVVMNRDMSVVDSLEQVKSEQLSQIHSSLFQPTDDETEKFNLHRCIRMLPHLQNTGAFFIAVIRKLSPTLAHQKITEPSSEVTTPSDTDADKALVMPAPAHKPKKKRPYHGFKEQPFIFLNSEDPDWLSIKEFYGIVDNFPVYQLTHRCSSGRKRAIHLVSRQTYNFIKANQELPERSSFVKVINGGMRLFSRAESEAGFRICQDGVHEILPYVKRDLIVPINKDDLVSLLAKKTIAFEHLSSEDHFKNRLKLGSCILMYTYQNANVQVDRIAIPLVAWRGERSVALYVSNTYKIHLQALVDDKLPEAEEVVSR